MSTITFTLPGQRLTTDVVSDTTIAVDEALLALTFDAGTNAVSYRIDAPDEPLPLITLAPEPVGISVDGVDVATLVSIFEPVTSIGQLDTSEGTTTFLDFRLEAIGDGNEAFSYLVVLDGPAFPEFRFASLAEDFFARTADTLSAPVPGSPFGPGARIELADLPGALVEGETVAPPADAIFVNGTPGPDLLIGGPGIDTLVGRGDADVMTGLDGADNFVLFSNDGPPEITVTDFTPEEGDRLAIDDRLLGLGDGSIDIRQPTLEEGLGLLRDGTVGYDRRAGIVTIDTDLDGVPDARADLGADVTLGFGDVVIF